MPARFSNHLEPQLLDLLLRNAAFTPPSGVYLGLFTALNTNSDGDSFTEIAGDGYARHAVTFKPASNGVAVSAIPIQFPVAQQAWGTVTHVGLFDAPTNGNLLLWLPLATSVVITSEDTLRIASGSFTVQLTGAVSRVIADALLNHLLRNQAWTPITSVYAALLSSYTNENTVTELSGSGYTRRPVSFTPASSDAASSHNSNAVPFPSATDSWGTITHVALYDAPSAGRLLWHGALETPRQVAVGQNFAFPQGAIEIAID